MKRHKKTTSSEAAIEENLSKAVSNAEVSSEAEAVPPEVDDHDIIDNRVPFIGNMHVILFLFVLYGVVYNKVQY